MVKIYKLCKGEKVVYVGKTKRTLKQRFEEHMKAKDLDSHLYSICLITEVSDEISSSIENLNINSYNTIIDGLNKIQARGKMSANVKASKLIDAEAKCKAKIKELKKKK